MKTQRIRSSAFVPYARRRAVLAAFLAALLFSGCETLRGPAEASGGEDGQSSEVRLEPAAEPEAAPEHDDGVEGLYKGVLTAADGSGAFRLDIRNSAPDDIELRGVYNGRGFSLSGRERFDPADETYTYTFDGQAGGGSDAAGAEAAGEPVRIEFETSISITGEIDSGNTTFRADGDPVNVNMMKESSDTLVRVYEGRYSGDSAGTWNFVRKGRSISGYYAGDGEGRFSGMLEPGDGGLRVWGVHGHLIARGTVDDDGRARGAWRFDKGAAYGETTAAAEYPDPGAEGANTWAGSRTL
jgi:hypothetical protein